MNKIFNTKLIPKKKKKNLLIICIRKSFNPFHKK